MRNFCLSGEKIRSVLIMCYFSFDPVGFNHVICQDEDWDCSMETSCSCYSSLKVGFCLGWLFPLHEFVHVFKCALTVSMQGICMLSHVCSSFAFFVLTRSTLWLISNDKDFRFFYACRFRPTNFHPLYNSEELNEVKQLFVNLTKD